jgi:hypothetical protein
MNQNSSEKKNKEEGGQKVILTKRPSPDTERKKMENPTKRVHQ